MLLVMVYFDILINDLTVVWKQKYVEETFVFSPLICSYATLKLKNNILKSKNYWIFKNTIL